MELISVIVPIYKVASILNRCIESLVNQQEVQLEIILVDDGSPDECPEICDLWAEKDKRIKVIHKKNGGLSDARNAGLRIAQGQYIAFVDSDDWIEKDLYRILLDAIKVTDSDIASCKILKVWEKSKQEFNITKDTFKYEVFNTKQGLYELIVENEIQQVVWNKLYKRTVIDDICFEVGKCNEDEFWTYQVLGKASQIVVVDYTGYYYWQRNDSIMSTQYSIKRLDAVEAKIYRQDYLEKYFSELSFVGKKNLLYSCLYHGQMTMKYINKSNRGAIMLWLGEIFTTYRLSKQEKKLLNGKDKLWIGFGSEFFEAVCWIRNIFGIGS